MADLTTHADALLPNGLKTGLSRRSSGDEEQEYWNKPPHPIVEPIVSVFPLAGPVVLTPNSL
jgi:hypothetical protein